MMVIEPQEAGEQIRAGNLRVIASLTEKRLASLANVPTIKEQGIDVPLIPQARGVVAPPAAPREVVQYWEGVFDRFAKTRELEAVRGTKPVRRRLSQRSGAEQILRRSDSANARRAQRSRRQSCALILFYERHAASGALRP